MDLSAKFPFAFNSAKMNASIHIGCFQNVSFFFVFDSNYRMKITRSKGSPNVSVLVDITFISLTHRHWNRRKTCSKSIGDGKKTALFSFNFERPISDLEEFRGGITISQLPGEEWTSEVPNNWSSILAAEGWSAAPIPLNNWSAEGVTDNWANAPQCNSSSECVYDWASEHQYICSSECEEWNEEGEWRGEKADPINSSTDHIPPSVDNSKSLPQLSDDLIRLLNNPDTFPDATLKCGAEDILVHKNILSVRSPVFAAMFKNEMQEGSSGVAEIVDIEPNVLQATLKYVYGGKTDHVDDGIAGDMLFVANKYQLEELKEVCVDKLKSSMTVDNVFRILVLGDLHDESLKTKTKEFICKCDKFSNLEKTEGWKLLQSEYPGLAMEVLLHVVKFSEK